MSSEAGNADRGPGGLPPTETDAAAAARPPDARPAILYLSVAVSVALLLAVFHFESHQAATEVLLRSLAVITALGKFAPLFPKPDGFLATPFHMAALVVYLDVVIALVAVYNVAALYRIPRFGAKLAGLRAFGQLMLARNPWMRKATFLGIVAFVMFPLSGTGSIGGSLLGQLLGMGRGVTLAGIVIGSLLGSFTMALLAGWILEAVGQDIVGHPLFTISGVIVVLAAVAWLTARYKKVSAAAAAEEGRSPGAR